MIYSILVAVACYYVGIFAIGVLVNTVAIEGSLVALAAIGFIGAYYTRRGNSKCKRNFRSAVHALAMGVGIFATVLLVAQMLLLPMITRTWIYIFAVLAGLALYAWSRIRVYRRLFKRADDGSLCAPPFGKNWCRWLFVILL